MTTTIDYPGNPVDNGATVIQANALTLVAGDYDDYTWEAAQRWVSQIGKDYFDHFPTDKTPNPNWIFYIRSDMIGSQSGQKTLIGVELVTKKANRSALNTTTMVSASFPTQRILVRVLFWHVNVITLTNGTTFSDVSLSGVMQTVHRDPEGMSWLLETDSWQMLQEAAGFCWKPVAASAPSSDPLMKIISGEHPLA